MEIEKKEVIKKKRPRINKPKVVYSTDKEINNNDKKLKK